MYWTLLTNKIHFFHPRIVLYMATCIITTHAPTNNLHSFLRGPKICSYHSRVNIEHELELGTPNDAFRVLFILILRAVEFVLVGSYIYCT